MECPDQTYRSTNGQITFDNMLSAIVNREVVITGKLPLLREDVVAWIYANGGRYHNRVRRKTDTLIVGDLPGRNTKKIERTLELHGQGFQVQIISGSDLCDLIKK